MNIRINFNLADIIEALDVVSTVTPHSTMANEGAGYLFVVRGTECFLYSSDETCISRAKFDLIESSGDGSFVFPAKNLSNSLRPLAKEEETCVIEANSDEDGRHTVKYVTSPDGAEAEFGSFSPDSISRYDEDLESATESYEFSPGVLREAINLARAFMADKSDQAVPEAFHGVEILDKAKFEKGDGYVYATNKFMAFFFRSDHFVGKKLAIHGNYISAFMSFLAKCGDKVVIKLGDNKTFAINEKGDVFGWTRHGELHDKFNYHALKTDSLVARINKGRLLHALECAKGAFRDKEKDSIILNFDSKTNKIWFDVPESRAKSIKVEASPVTEAEEGTTQSKADSFASTVSAKQLTELVQSMKGYEINFRGYLGKPKEGKKQATCLFRTIDEFYLDPATGKATPNSEEGILCRVTRFMPSQAK
jgi:hypothetical protein